MTADVLEFKKQCPSCAEFKVTSEFNKNKSHPDGLAWNCRPCSKTYARQRKSALGPYTKKTTVTLPSGWKKCGTCRTAKLVRDFHADRCSFDGLQSNCSACHSAQSREYRYAAFGMTRADYDAANAAQGGVCAICGRPETSTNGRSGATRRLAVDHCHRTGRPRGLLCNNHNVMIGYAQDDIEILRAAIRYLENPPALSLVA